MNLLDLFDPNKLIDPDHKYTPNSVAQGNPVGIYHAITDKREGKPFVQSTARNFGHALFGEKIGNAVDQNLLGDSPPQGPTSQSLQTQQLPNGGVQGTDAQNPMLMMIQKWMQTQGGQ